MPCLPQLSFMLLDDRHNPGQFSSPETMIVRYANRSEPYLRNLPFPHHVDVSRFLAVAREKEEAVGTAPEYRRAHRECLPPTTPQSLSDRRSREVYRGVPPPRDFFHLRIGSAHGLRARCYPLGTARPWDAHSRARELVDRMGFEPTAFPMRSGRTLDGRGMVDRMGFEPTASSLRTRRSPS
jgi:hypothetical protein